MKNRAFCYNCTSKDISYLLKIDSMYAIYTCHRCLISFTYPQPKRNSVGNINESKYDSSEEFQSRIKNYNEEYKRAKKHVLMFMKYKKSGKYLDVGCSYGVAVKAAKDAGFDAFGIEPTKKAATYAKNTLHVRVRSATLQAAKLKSNLFDVVSLYDVLEHIPDIRSFIQEVKRALKPNGLLVVQSPNITSYAFRILQKDWNWLLVPNHLWHFSPKSLKNSLKVNDFFIKEISTQDNVYDFSSNLTSKILQYKNSRNPTFRIMRKLIFVFCFGTIFIFSPLWSKLGKGGSLQVYAIKK